MEKLSKTAVNDLKKDELVDAYLKLQDKHEVALKERDNAKDALKVADDRIDELESDLEEIPKQAAKPTLKVGQKTYELTIPKFAHPDTSDVMDFEKLKADSDLAKRLVEMGFAGLKEVSNG